MSGAVCRAADCVCVCVCVCACASIVPTPQIRFALLDVRKGIPGRMFSRHSGINRTTTGDGTTLLRGGRFRPIIKLYANTDCERGIQTQFEH